MHFVALDVHGSSSGTPQAGDGGVEPSDRLVAPEHLQRLEQRRADAAAGDSDADRRLGLAELDAVRVPTLLEHAPSATRHPSEARAKPPAVSTSTARDHGWCIALAHESLVDDRIRPHQEVDHRRRIGQRHHTGLDVWSHRREHAAVIVSGQERLAGGDELLDR